MKQLVAEYGPSLKIYIIKGEESDSILFHYKSLTINEKYVFDSDYIKIEKDRWNFTLEAIKDYFCSLHISKKDLHYIGTCSTRLFYFWQFDIWYIGGLFKEHNIRLKHNTKEEVFNEIRNLKE